MPTRYYVLISIFVLMALASGAWADALPGAPAAPTELQSRLEAALQAKGPDYRPRTEHLQADGSPRFINRLIAEDSPYLLQHAHNPVNWFAWGEEAFEKARREKKPIFLSIGYATCHWCHVMERESFESIPIARYLNEHFVAIKVDRERRPDLDELYMTAVVLITGQGGWPMSTFLTPDRKPFLGGTYFPPQTFQTLLERIQELWTTRQSDLVTQAEQLAAAVSQTMAAGGQARQIGEAAIQQGVAAILGSFNEPTGGFGDAPKFPHESYLMLLLHAAQKRQDNRALAAVTSTLDAMARGGIYDQVGGGFHRYATDSRWRVPHFEKMLYNQALLASVYTNAYRSTGKPRYARIARQTLAYVLRDMTSPEGAFYSATDADSDGREGAFFVWTPEQIRSALPPQEAALAIDVYGVTPEGNFEDDSILYLPAPLDEYARRANRPLATLLNELDAIRGRLRLAREKRPHPLGDDKMILAWNAMMITALAEAAEVLADPHLLEAAKRCAELLWTAQRRDDGGLWRVHWRGRPSITATQDDYAYFAQALIGLYDASGDPIWLQRARLVTDAMLARFWDEQQGGFFMSPGDDSTLFARPKDPTDGAIPSGNSVAVRVLAALAKRTGEDSYRNRADATVAAFSGKLERSPGNFAYMLLGLDEHLHGELSHRQYGARGHLKATAQLVKGDNGLTVTLGLAMAPGWHINAHQPRQAYLIPTTVSLAGAAAGWRLEAIEYPDAELMKLGFENQLLALYQGNLALRARLVPTTSAVERDGGHIALELRMQACNDQACLPPETLRLDIPLVQSGNASAAHEQ